MKKLGLFVLLVLILLLYIGYHAQSINGEYEFDKLILIGPLSTLFADTEKMSLGTKYIIDDNEFTKILPKGKSYTWSNLSYTKEVVNDVMIEGYVCSDRLRERFFSKYSDGHRYTIRDETNVKIGYIIFVMDDDTFICEGNLNSMMCLSRVKKIK